MNEEERRIVHEVECEAISAHNRKFQREMLRDKIVEFLLGAAVLCGFIWALLQG